MIRFACPHCGKEAEVEEAYAGRRGPCPSCGQMIEVPPSRLAGTGRPASAQTQGPTAAAVAPPQQTGPVKTAPWSIASLVCGLLSCLGITGLLAIIFGILGMRQVNRSQGRLKGRGLAIAGIILGCLFGIIGIICIIGLIVTNCVSGVVWRIDQAKVMAARSQTKLFQSAIESFKMDQNRYPTEAEGLDALITRPGDAVTWPRGGYVNMNRIPLDPWNRPYVLRIVAIPDGEIVEVVSYGKDGKPGGAGLDADIINGEVKSQDGPLVEP